jgi:competence protein ComEA
MPLSEALAARRHANRPWWRRASQSIEQRVPPTLRGRWALSLPAATAVALVALTAAGVGGWYLTRSQGAVVEVGGVGGGGGGGNAGEAAASITPAPDDAHATSNTDNSGKPLAAGRDGTCHPRRPTDATSAAPTRWTTHAHAHVMKVVPIAAAIARADAKVLDVQAVPDTRLAKALDARGVTDTRLAKALDARAASDTRLANVLDARAASDTKLSKATDQTPAPTPPRPRPMTNAATPLARWHRAPITHRYAEAMANHHACPPQSPGAPAPALTNPTAVGEPSAVVVDIEGKVAHPGVQTLPTGSRVYEALAAAGGALPGVDVTGLDLARPVADGEQLRVGIAGGPTPAIGLPETSAGGGARGKRGKPSQPVNLNTATLEQLESLPDVGPALAQRILDWRTEHGRFGSVTQLQQVRGIGQRKFADMQDSATV